MHIWFETPWSCSGGVQALLAMLCTLFLDIDAPVSEWFRAATVTHSETTGHGHGE